MIRLREAGGKLQWPRTAVGLDAHSLLRGRQERA